MERSRSFLRRTKKYFRNTLRKPPRRRGEQIRMKRIFHDGETIKIPNPIGSYLTFNYSPEYMYQWIKLLNTNNEFSTWNEERFAEEMMGNLIDGSEFLLIDQGKLISVSAAFSIGKYQPYAVLAYPIVHPEYRGQGIGTYLISKTLQSCKNAGYPGVILYTDDYRIPAIHVYNKLGFEVDTTEPN